MTLTSERTARGRAVALICAALMVAGCAHEHADDTGTAERLLGVSPSQPGFNRMGGPAALLRPPYPLAVGNRWDYSLRTASVVVSPSGPLPPALFEGSLTDQIGGTERVGTRLYYLHSQVAPNASTARFAPLRIRQDRSGLFELDTPQFRAAADATDAVAAQLARSLSDYVERTVGAGAQRAAWQRAALQLAKRAAIVRQEALGSPLASNRGADPGEITLLRYPLLPGAQWTVSESPLFARTVVARERVNVPAGSWLAWKLQNTSEFLGPNERVFLWYANVGLVRATSHLETVATDDAGNPIGLLTFDSDQQLTNVHLVDPRGPRAFAVDALPVSEEQ
jgi:hypothetical protein